MGSWYVLGWRLAAMIAPASTDPAARSLRSLATLEGKQQSPLMLDVLKVDGIGVASAVQLKVG